MKVKTFCMAILLVIASASLAFAVDYNPKIAGKCMTCHKEKSPGLYNQWYMSAHADHNVTCLNCHGADKKDKDAFEHEGALIAALVTPKDCGQCHEREFNEAANSYHATAGHILESNDAYLAHVAGGEPAAITGCENCHGTKVEIDSKSPNKLSRKSWPNSGIGRINPDGSLGSCNACHARHSFRAAQARQPEACSKCHLGPDHPQKEIYEESKHGNSYYTNLAKMNIDSDRWIVGQDYYEAPTCATCHMSEAPTQKVTHDVGQRISWTLRPIVSKHKDDWHKKRASMKQVCVNCHGETFVDGHYYQFDALVNLYNEKFAKPALDIMNIVKKNKLMENPAGFSNDIEWSFWELWHHEGRRARHGAAMMGPDYTWWHGIYDVAHNFYFEFLPQARAYNNAEVNAYIDKIIKDDPMHQWLSQDSKTLKESIKKGKMQKIYKNLFESN
ncbi:MAG: hydroxylamine oxidoreductase [candidate division Zixibacteria bacterium]|nr:hydroxylamine oxidoreductase [candidate division Zixibacteria bacterium]